MAPGNNDQGLLRIQTQHRLWMSFARKNLNQSQTDYVYLQKIAETKQYVKAHLKDIRSKIQTVRKSLVTFLKVWSTDLGDPRTLSKGPRNQNYFHNKTNPSVAFFTMSTFCTHGTTAIAGKTAGTVAANCSRSLVFFTIVPSQQTIGFIKVYPWWSKIIYYTVWISENISF